MIYPVVYPGAIIPRDLSRLRRVMPRPFVDDKEEEEEEEELEVPLTPGRDLNLSSSLSSISSSSEEEEAEGTAVAETSKEKAGESRRVIISGGGEEGSILPNSSGRDRAMYT